MSKDKYVWIREYFLDNMIDKNQAFNFTNKPTPGYIPVTIVRGHDNIIVGGMTEETKEAQIPTDLFAKAQEAIDSVPTLRSELRPGEKVLPKQFMPDCNSYIGPQINIKLDPKLSNEQIMETVKTSVEKAIKEVKENPRYRWKIKHKTTGHTLVTKYYYEKFDPNDIHEYGNNCYFNYEAVGPHFDPGEKK